MQSNGQGGGGHFVFTPLPCPLFEQHWDRMVMPASFKETLLGYGRCADAVRSGGAAPLMSGIVVFAGPPGTGKSTLARGWAQVISRTVYKGRSLLAEIQCEQLFSDRLGGSAKETAQAFSELRFIASTQRVIVVADEVEWITYDRSRAAATSDTPDQIRAVAALLRELDSIAANPNVLLVCTINLPELTDAAFWSRADMVFQLGLPDLAARRQILASELRRYERLGLSASTEEIDRAAAASEGCSGRDLAKVPWLASVLARKEFSAVTGDDLVMAVAHVLGKQQIRKGGGDGAAEKATEQRGRSTSDQRERRGRQLHPVGAAGQRDGANP